MDAINQPLLDVPVPQGRVGLIVCGGLNPIAAVDADAQSALVRSITEDEVVVDALLGTGFSGEVRSP